MATITHGGVPAPSLPYADRVRHVSSDQPFQWLAAGWRDFLAAPAASLAYGLVFVVIGFALTYGLWRMDKMYMLLPFASGFVLLVPLLSLGFHAISRDIEQNRRPSFSGALFAWQTNAGSMVNAGLAFMFLFLLWLRLSEIVFALTFPPTATLDIRGLLNATFFTVGGLEFLALFLALGACVTALAFMGGAFALPMLLDRDASMAEAIATSFTACVMNIRAMLVWATLVAVLIAAGMALFYVGLAITLPLVGHASWHAYRAVIIR
jgi:uncharacterized membrane protein